MTDSLTFEQQDLIAAAEQLESVAGAIGTAWHVCDFVERHHRTKNGPVSTPSNLAVGHAGNAREDACIALIECCTQLAAALRVASNAYTGEDLANYEKLQQWS